MQINDLKELKKKNNQTKINVYHTFVNSYNKEIV